VTAPAEKGEASAEVRQPQDRTSRNGRLDDAEPPHAGARPAYEHGALTQGMGRRAAVRLREIHRERAFPASSSRTTVRIERLVDVYQRPPTKSRVVGVLVEQMFDCDLGSD